MSSLISRSLLSVLIVLFLMTGATNLMAVSLNNVASGIILSDILGARKYEVLRCGQVQKETEADSFAKKALVFRPNAPRSIVNLGRSAWLEGQCTTAEDNWKKVLAANPRSQVAAFWLYWASGGDVGSLSDRLSIELMANYAYESGNLANKAEDPEAALDWYELSMELEPSRKAATRISYLYQHGEQIEQAVGVWQYLSEVLSRDHADYWWALGQVAELERRWEEAARVYGIGSEIAVEPYDFWVRQGYALRRLERWEKAEETYRQALAVDPGNFWPYMYLGYVQSKQGNYEAARSWYELAWKLAPDDFNPMYHLGVTSFRQERYVEAKKWLEAASEVLPDNLWCIYYLAQTSYHLEEFVRAENFLSQAVSLHPGKPWEWAVQLGDWRLALGEQQGALDMYRQALIWRPNEEIIQNRIEVLQKR
jgi:tetratricopeptide (TPR) repeat protein